nr:hypothetical protein GCM10020092_011940 [Actinoplanes digitatis]
MPGVWIRQLPGGIDGSLISLVRNGIASDSETRSTCTTGPAGPASPADPPAEAPTVAGFRPLGAVRRGVRVPLRSASPGVDRPSSARHRRTGGVRQARPPLTRAPGRAYPA